MKTRTLLNFPLGILLGSVVSLFLASLIDDSVSDAVAKNWTYLVTAASALFSAGIALSGVFTTIEHQRELARKVRQAKLIAAKAMLPMALSRFTVVASRGAEVCLGEKIGIATAEDLLEQISLSPQDISTIKETIEQAEPDDAARLANLIRTYQVVHSRTKGYLSGAYGPITMSVENALDWAVLFRLVEDCFAYARSETEGIPDALKEALLRQFFAVRLKLPPVTMAQIVRDIARREANPKLEIF